MSLAGSLVAVHGLGGHALNTWTHSQSGTCWIRDLLPDRLPHIRVMAFGYNARKTRHQAELDFLDVALQLLAGLARLRKQHFVGIGPGGSTTAALIVCKGVQTTYSIPRSFLGRSYRQKGKSTIKIYR